MKKVLVIIGSPRKEGNTSISANKLIDELDNSKYITEKVFLYDSEISPCDDCRGCKKGDLECVISDGMTDLYEKLNNSDILIFGTPIYWFGSTAKMKLLIDRFRPYFVNKKLEGKKAALLLPAGVGESDCDLTTEMFKRVFEALKIDFLGLVPAKAYDEGDILEDAIALNLAKELAKTINE